jgi:hypothetical protein
MEKQLFIPSVPSIVRPGNPHRKERLNTTDFLFNIDTDAIHSFKLLRYSYPLQQVKE